MDEEWLLKGCQRSMGESYVVDRFTDEAECRKEMERMKRDFPGHLFWCENYSTKDPKDAFWVGD